MKPESIIGIESLGKSYLLSHQTERAPYQRLSDALVHSAKAPLRWLSRNKPQTTREVFWALRDVSFEITRGEVVGIIGHNGAGKSTLLKLLSRITAPTMGRITLRGTVGSLLEVGTGFHPELTGRENIFLNGAMLGMTRVQVSAKFDEIVAFAEVEKFLDTPVKRYSSGMYVRLAFAIAAHLDPEILIIDEVLAVGDAAFQKKCLGKMEQSAQGGGRTVIFVSHNLSAVSRLCSRVIVLDHGRLVFDGPTQEGIEVYSGLAPTTGAVVNLSDKHRPQPVLSGVKLMSISLTSHNEGQQAWMIDYGVDLELQITVQSNGTVHEIEPGVAVHSGKGFEIASWTSAVTGGNVPIQPGLTAFSFRWQNFRLVPGVYHLSLGMRSPRGFEDYLPEVVRFEVVRTTDSAAHGVETFSGCIVPLVDFKVASLPVAP
ncbi:ABC transporter ATP-binding protein [Prosthecobacter sp.]|uniref:ABC transporter ATP-binding protein n=1 Tax=Prosthecobacter sp. TaxID=1965333 RepID=UPI0037836002